MERSVLALLNPSEADSTPNFQCGENHANLWIDSQMCRIHCSKTRADRGDEGGGRRIRFGAYSSHGFLDGDVTTKKCDSAAADNPLVGMHSSLWPTITRGARMLGTAQQSITTFSSVMFRRIGGMDSSCSSRDSHPRSYHNFLGKFGALTQAIKKQLLVCGSFVSASCGRTN